LLSAHRRFAGLDQENVFAGHVDEPAFGRVDAALARELQHGVLDARIIPAIVVP
jgi:hypothetical protein